MIGSNMKRVIALIAASAAAVSLAACGSNSSQDSKTIEFWDPYPQKNDSSTWAKYVTNCAPEGYNVKTHRLCAVRPIKQSHNSRQGRQRTSDRPDR